VYKNFVFPSRTHKKESVKNRVLLYLLIIIIVLLYCVFVVVLCCFERKNHLHTAIDFPDVNLTQRRQFEELGNLLFESRTGLDVVLHQYSLRGVVLP